MSNREYTLEFTPLAKVLAERHHTLDEVEAEVRQEIDDALDSGLESVDKLMFATAACGSMFDESIPKFIATPKGNGVLLVDVAEYEDHGELDQGPFAGMTVSIPVGDGRSE